MPKKPDIGIRLLTESFYAMHTRMNIATYGIDEFLFCHVVERIRDETAKIEKQISRFIPGNILSSINNRTSKVVKEIDPDVFNLLFQCRKYYEKTYRYFDISVNKEQPSVSVFKNIEFDEKNFSITFPDTVVLFDLGAVGKGVALERIKVILDEKNIENMLVSFGESSILVLGHHPWGNCWKIGITEPEEKTIIHEWEATNLYISTSRSLNGHIINPHTGKRVFSGCTVSVVGKNGVETEVLSTALLSAPDEEREKIICNFPGLKYVIYNKENNEKTG